MKQIIGGSSRPGASGAAVQPSALGVLPDGPPLPRAGGEI